MLSSGSTTAKFEVAADEEAEAEISSREGESLCIKSAAEEEAEGEEDEKLFDGRCDSGVDWVDRMLEAISSKVGQEEDEERGAMALLEATVSPPPPPPLSITPIVTHKITSSQISILISAEKCKLYSFRRNWACR